MPKIMDTQAEAWQAILARFNECHRVVMQALIDYPQGLTTAQIAGILGKGSQSVSGRITWLKKHGHVIDSGERRRNPDTGANGAVWTVKREGGLF